MLLVAVTSTSNSTTKGASLALTLNSLNFQAVINPTDPTNPNKPSDPTNPTQPTDPANPTDPQKSIDNAGNTNSTNGSPSNNSPTTKSKPTNASLISICVVTFLSLINLAIWISDSNCFI